jgi:cholesterol transport system auxiliary component
MFAALLAETIRAGGKHLVFASGDAITSGGSRLSGRLLDFGYDAPSKTAVVRYDAVWTAPGGAVTTKRFEARVKVAQPKAEPVGHALNQAANDVAVQVAAWLG